MASLDYKRLWKENRRDIAIFAGAGSVISVAWIVTSALIFSNPVTPLFVIGYSVLGSVGNAVYIIGSRHISDILKYRDETWPTGAPDRPGFIPAARTYLEKTYMRKDQRPGNRDPGNPGPG